MPEKDGIILMELRRSDSFIREVILCAPSGMGAERGKAGEGAKLPQGVVGRTPGKFMWPTTRDGSQEGSLRVASGPRAGLT
jgi:hypothetical protein